MVVIWTSRSWGQREKVLATAMTPGGPIFVAALIDGVVHAHLALIIEVALLCALVPALAAPSGVAVYLVLPARSHRLGHLSVSHTIAELA
jgi:hypothetical protein